MKLFRVGLFTRSFGVDPLRVDAYTRLYRRDHPDCCEHAVAARNRTEAKTLAKAEHQRTCRRRTT